MSEPSNGRPTLGLAMIVRNELEHLGAWLPQAADYLDEIVIVDTGSNDGTVEWLRTLPVTLLQQPWAHDFALHRNYGLEHVTADWVLILDADERLDKAGWQALRKLLTTDRTIAYLFPVKNYHTKDDLSAYDLMRSYRLFRNGYGIRYEGAVHNQLAPSIERACIEQGMETAEAGIAIEHFGYALDEPAMKAKQQRIYDMVKRQLEQTPGDPYYLFHLLTVCLAAGRYEEARATAGRIPFGSLRPELQAPAYYKAAQAALYFDEHDRAYDWIQRALRAQPRAAFLHYLRSNILYQMHRFGEGLRAAYRALEYAGQSDQIENGVHVTVDECLLNIGLGYLLSEEYTSAVSYFREALKHNPANESARRHLEWIDRRTTAMAGRPRRDESCKGVAARTFY